MAAYVGGVVFFCGRGKRTSIFIYFYQNKIVARGTVTRFSITGCDYLLAYLE
ncbi:hypothetical protein ETAE_1931 [Edwardsiella piscicida]|uniref:Uncharacterized protein n=1 Tax=Edwardsiella piscicida TaxID=1263550 RepID=A0AAU8P3H4_EDWPI|nr:hypothetical protein ETAE_1931 [Edwardsiella tarda EIB202]